MGVWAGLDGFIGMVFLGLDGIWMFPKNRGNKKTQIIPF